MLLEPNARSAYACCLRVYQPRNFRPLTVENVIFSFIYLSWFTVTKFTSPTPSYRKYHGQQYRRRTCEKIGDFFNIFLNDL